MEKVAPPPPHSHAKIPTVEKGGVPSFRNFRDCYFSKEEEEAPKKKKQKKEKKVDLSSSSYPLD